MRENIERFWHALVRDPRYRDARLPQYDIQYALWRVLAGNVGTSPDGLDCESLDDRSVWIVGLPPMRSTLLQVRSSTHITISNLDGSPNQRAIDAILAAKWADTDTSGSEPQPEVTVQLWGPDGTFGEPQAVSFAPIEIEKAESCIGHVPALKDRREPTYGYDDMSGDDVCADATNDDYWRLAPKKDGEG